MNHPPKVVYLTAGAGGMYCGSCLRDNALAAGLSALGWDVTLLPLYTPIRVDEEDRSVDQVFFGNVLQTSRDAIYLARHVGLRAGLPVEVPALTGLACARGSQRDAGGAAVTVGYY